LPAARESHTVLAPADGVLVRLDALAVGLAAWRLGAGRARKEDDVSPTAGIRCLAKPGDYVQRGEPVLELLADDPDRFAPALEALDGSLTIAGEPLPAPPLIVDQVGA
jgi:thymidine phosphorylase